jgi:hypothetical protein
MSSWVGLQLAGRPPVAWLSAVLVGLLSLEGCAIWDEPDSETSPHPASTRTNKDAASMHPNQILFSRATMVAPSLLVTVCVSYGNQRTTHRGTIPTSRPDTRSSIPSTCPDLDVHTSRFEPPPQSLGPRVAEDPRSGFNGVRGGSGGTWSKSADRRRPEGRSHVATSGEIPTASPAPSKMCWFAGISCGRC